VRQTDEVVTLEQEEWLDHEVAGGNSPSAAVIAQSFQARTARRFFARASDLPPGNTVIWRRSVDIQLGFELKNCG
jgi:hypothetical protein